MNNTELIPLDELLKKRPEIFSYPCVINVKVDQMAIVVERCLTGEVRFYNRNGKDHLSIPRRAAADHYEQAISYLKERAKNLPIGTRVFLEWFDPNLNTTIQYSKRPDSQLMISYVVLNGIKLMPTSSLVESIAKILQVDSPPIIFRGILYPQMVEALNGSDRLSDKIADVFGIPKEIDYLVIPECEGLVWYFLTKTEVIIAKQSNPEWQAARPAKEVNPYIDILQRWVFEHLDEVTVDPWLPHNQRSISAAATAVSEWIWRDQLINMLKSYYALALETRISHPSYHLIDSEFHADLDARFWAGDLFRITLQLLLTGRKRIDPTKGLDQVALDRLEMLHQIC